LLVCSIWLYLHAEKPSKTLQVALPSFRDCAAEDTSPVTVVDATEGTDYRFKRGKQNKIQLKETAV